MTGAAQGGDGAGSPACAAAQVAPDYFDPLGVEPQQVHDVARWRKARRADLLASRASLGVEALHHIAQGIGTALDAVLAHLHVDPAGKTLAAYWPIKSEPDLRPWLGAMHTAGVHLALPAVAERGQPLLFRPWQPGATMLRGFWNILEPATEATVIPDIALVPLVGWDGAGYRLGYGGGYYDRTLARISPLTIGVGLHAARLPTIYPQPHDIGLAAIVTEAGIEFCAQ